MDEQNLGSKKWIGKQKLKCKNMKFPIPYEINKKMPNEHRKAFFLRFLNGILAVPKEETNELKIDRIWLDQEGEELADITIAVLR